MMMADRVQRVFEARHGPDDHAPIIGCCRTASNSSGVSTLGLRRILSRNTDFADIVQQCRDGECPAGVFVKAEFCRGLEAIY